MQSDTATLEDSLAVSYKTKLIRTLQSRNCVLSYILRGVENLCSHKNTHMYVYSSFIHNCQNSKATKMSFSRWMDRWWINNSYPDNRILFSILLSERSQPENAITYCMIPTTADLWKTWVWTVRVHLYTDFFSTNTYYSTKWSTVGWIHGYRTADMKCPL